jgi:hypothetical protein
MGCGIPSVAEIILAVWLRYLNHRNGSALVEAVANLIYIYELVEISPNPLVTFGWMIVVPPCHADSPWYETSKLLKYLY